MNDSAETINANPESVAAWKREAAKLETQRDALLEALQECADNMRLVNVNAITGGKLERFTASYDKARAAIRLARGEK